ncbi:DUF4142 domain-containing protein [Rhizobium sp. NFR03]|uniref:DUF4142 domain-containing protein n=1 Tax=Rhizobium sp. NFR03 TaxID=1566263 RepID=UPI0008C41EA5|nr:DUF4142 domain-containing protein [Rhizobium sp. NFR03]SES44664.1 protein of unknown function [Rhizobium sp. NFR03]
MTSFSMILSSILRARTALGKAGSPWVRCRTLLKALECFAGGAENVRERTCRNNAPGPRFVGHREDTSTTVSTPLSVSVRRAAIRVRQGGDYSTATSQLAASRARNRMVRTFAQLEIEEQAAVAKGFGARPGQAGIDPRHQAMLADLEAARGADFDQM